MAYSGPLSLTCFLCLLTFSTGTIPRPTLFVTAPNVFRIGVEETVVVNVLNVNEPIDVTINLQDRSNGSPHVYSHVILKGVKPDKPEKVSIGLRFDDIPSLTLESQYAYLFVESTSSQLDIPFREGKEVLVTYNSTFVFIQVDKPIYNPQQNVSMHIIPVGLDLKPSKEPIRIDIINPKGTIIEREEGNITDSGLIRKEYRFPAHPVFGKWSVIVYYGPMYRFKTKAHFTVKEHVLPKFNVKISADEYILSSTDKIAVGINAKYPYGKSVNGRLSLRVGIQDIDKTIVKIHTEIDFTELLQNQSKGVFNHQNRLQKAIQMISLNEIFETNWFELFLGKYVYLEARVIEAATGIMEKMTTAIPIVEHKYHFAVDNTLRFFKRGLPFEVKADVLLPSGQPVDEGIRVRAKCTCILSNGTKVKLAAANDHVEHHRTNRNGQINFFFTVPLNAEEVVVNLTTNDNTLARVDQNGFVLFEARPYESPNENYMLIRILHEDFDKLRVAVGTELQAQVILSDSSSVQRIIHYMVIARNKVMAQNTIESMLNEPVNLPVFVTNDLVPFVRIVAFYIDENQDVVADSIILEVENVCENTVSISVIDNGNSIKPNKDITLIVDGKPSTRVGLMAVDKSVYNLENYERLSKEKLFKKMRGFDLGCGPGGGSSTEDVFERAGITVITNANLNVQRREGLDCPIAASRRRRSIYDDELNEELQEMCNKGRQKATSKSCDDAAAKIAEKKLLSVEDKLIKRFYNCCVEEVNSNLVKSTRQSTVTVDKNDFESRTEFPERWLFEEIEIGENGFEQLTLTTPGSITTWFVHGTGISNDVALCVADPLEVKVFKPFFMKLDLPYSVISGERVHIQVVLYNYVEEDFEVDVFMFGVTGVCLSDSSDEDTQSQSVTLKGNDQALVAFIIVPMLSGSFDITVGAIATSSTREERDSVVRNLKVIPDGLHHMSTLSLILDPSNSVKSAPYEEDGIFKHTHIASESGIPQGDVVTISLPSDVVKGSDTLILKLTGDPIGPTLTTIAEGLEGALELPTACGEQTLIQFAPHIHALSYLNATGQLTLPIYNQAQRVLKEGYDREMAFFQDDGSYKEWKNSDHSSTWLTAFATLTMCEANQFIFIDSQVISKSIHWLMNHQNMDGHFNETYLGRDTVDGLKGKAALTAHVLTTLVKCKHHVTFSVHQSIKKATEYLEVVISNKAIENKYALAITTYALSLAHSKSRHTANTKLLSLASEDEELGYHYWNVEETTLEAEELVQCWRSFKPSSISVKTTGYALLAQIKLGNMDTANEVADWMVRQQRHLTIGFQSTTCNCGVGLAQSACVLPRQQQFVQNLISCDVQVGMQALAEYAKKTHASSSLNLDVKVKFFDDKIDSTILNLRKNNALVQQQLEIVDAARKRIVIETNGTGTAQLQMSLAYNTKAKVNFKPCIFSVAASTTEVKNSKKNGRNLRYEVRACARNLQEKKVAMGVLEVQLFSGFSFIKDTVIKRGGFKEFEEANRSVLFYLEPVPRDDSSCVTFEIEQLFTVVSIQPVTVSMYDYSEPDNKCTEFYQPPGGSELLSLLCVNETCQCSDEKCATFSSESSLEELVEHACSSDYVYEITVKRVEQHEHWYKYTGKITPLTPNHADIIKKEASSTKRTFWLSKGCKHLMKKNRKYLVMGPNSIVHSSRGGKTEYLLDGNAHIELIAKREALKGSNFARHISESCQKHV
ncbi:complement C3-like [Antedon mediterranea]|uniref:complement C3-like n=1 Tax=Antedon mediterranea TaxID=105859 RepID=UPI003AF55605